MADMAARHLGNSYNALATSVERLASGLRINTAKDDAAGLAVRELMRADIAVLQQGVRNTQDGISMVQTMEGAMATINDALVRMKQLAEQAATGVYSSAQRDIMNNEFEEMAAEIDRIAQSTVFNSVTLLDSASDTVTVHFGQRADGTDDTIDVADCFDCYYKRYHCLRKCSCNLRLQDEPYGKHSSSSWNSGREPGDSRITNFGCRCRYRDD
jgi:flagellin